jgi:methionyl-tRNA formyltransferase
LDENSKENDLEAGKIFEEDELIKVKTGKGNIILEEIQLEGKTKVKINDFVNGYPDFIGSQLK